MQLFLRRVLCTFMACLLVLGPIQSVFAQELTDTQKEEFQKYTEEAGEKFEAKDYDGAVESFKQAYELKAVSNILYNIARIYEQTGQMEGALEYYELFVKSPNVEHGPRQDAMARIKTLKEVLALEEPPEEAPKEEAPVAEAEYDYTVAYIFWGAAVAALGTSLAFGILTSGQVDTFENSTDLEEARLAKDTATTYGYIADGTLLAGLVLATVGTIVFFKTGPTEAEGVTVAPIIGSDRVGLGLSTSF